MLVGNIVTACVACVRALHACVRALVARLCRALCAAQKVFLNFYSRVHRNVAWLLLSHSRRLTGFSALVFFNKLQLFCFYFFFLFWFSSLVAQFFGVLSERVCQIHKYLSIL